MWATFLFAASAVLFWFRRPVRVVRRPSQQAGRSGYTIVELLVTLGIIAILLAVILPSVQRARDRAHVAQCASHLRQFGIAMAGFESAHQCFPNPDQLPGVAREIPQQKRPAFSPHVGLLSWLDLGSLESRIDYREASPDGDDPVTSSSNKTLVETLVPIFRCPSDAGVFPGNSYRACTGTSPALHTTPSLDAKIASLIGWHSGAKTSSSSVIDGLSHTVFFSERTLGDRDPARFTPYRDLALQASGTMLLPDDAVAACTLTISSKPGHLSFMGSNWLYDGTLETAYNHVLEPNSRVIDCTSWSSPILLPPGAVSARSLHPGGVNALLGDGSVRFFASQIDRQLWRALGSISGHEPTDEL